MWESSLKLHKYLVINQLNLSTYFSTSYGVKFSYFIQCFINLSTCYYNYIVVPSLIRWSSFKLALVVFLLVPIFFDHSLAFSYHKMLYAYLSLTLPSPAISPRVHGYFGGKWYLEVNFWVMSVLITIGLSCFQFISLDRGRIQRDR